MPFRRKCDDELVPEKITIPFKRGPLGPVLVYLIGYDANRPVPFGEHDPDGTIRAREQEILVKDLGKQLAFLHPQ